MEKTHEKYGGWEVLGKDPLTGKYTVQMIATCSCCGLLVRDDLPLRCPRCGANMTQKS